MRVSLRREDSARKPLPRPERSEVPVSAVVAKLPAMKLPRNAMVRVAPVGRPKLSRITKLGMRSVV